MKYFDSYNALNEEIKSIWQVLDFIETNPNPSVNHTLCNSNIIILGTLLESYLENIVLEYIDKLTVLFNNKKITFTDLPEKIQVYASKAIVHKYHKSEFDSMRYDEAFKLIKKIFNEMPQDGFLIDNELEGINKFSFGKHGEVEIKKLFNRINIDLDNIFENFDDLNNFFNLRNNLIHSENVSLTKIPPQDVENIKTFVLKLYIFGKKINRHLIKQLSLLPAI